MLNKMLGRCKTCGQDYCQECSDHEHPKTKKHCLFKPECLEIWRCCKKLAILHTHVYPTSWMKDAKRIAMVAITMGSLKQVRILQIFQKIEN